MPDAKEEPGEIRREFTDDTGDEISIRTAWSEELGQTVEIANGYIYGVAYFHVGNIPDVIKALTEIQAELAAPKSVTAKGLRT